MSVVVFFLHAAITSYRWLASQSAGYAARLAIFQSQNGDSPHLVRLRGRDLAALREQAWREPPRTCPEITWYLCNQFTPDLPTKMRSYNWTSTLHLLKVGPYGQIVAGLGSLASIAHYPYCPQSPIRTNENTPLQAAFCGAAYQPGPLSGWQRTMRTLPI
jgi:hypothetical protein